ncbi:MAG: PHP-associated domain-containing protein [Nanoarchaeota archaeon]
MSTYSGPLIDRAQYPNLHPFDLHIHTRSSPDTDTTITELLMLAKQHGFGIAITDHNVISGCLEAMKQEEVPVLPGIEVTSNENLDFLCYFPSKDALVSFYTTTIEPHQRHDWLKTSKLAGTSIIAACHSRGGVICLAHPYRFNGKLFRLNGPSLVKHYLPQVDAVEVANGRTIQMLNNKALKKAEEQAKCFLGGSDAHHVTDLVSAFTLFKSKEPRAMVAAIKEGDTVVIGKGMKVIIKMLRSGRKAVSRLVS